MLDNFLLKTLFISFSVISIFLDLYILWSAYYKILSFTIIANIPGLYSLKMCFLSEKIFSLLFIFRFVVKYKYTNDKQKSF